MAESVLIVDDSAAIRQSISYVLDQNGYDVIEANDGVDGLSKLPSPPVKLIITDVNMPNLDGINFVRKVREKEEYKYVPIIILTTESQNSKMEEGKEAGATGWIVKPFSADKLLNVIKKVAG